MWVTTHVIVKYLTVLIYFCELHSLFLVHCGIFLPGVIVNSNMMSFFRFVDKRAIYRCYNLIHTCVGECDWLLHWQHKLCATFSTNVNINYRLPIKVYFRICTLRHIRIEINHGSQNVFWVLTWLEDINKFYPSLLARDEILISVNPC